MLMLLLKTALRDCGKPSDISAIGDHTVVMGQRYQDWLVDNPLATIGWRPTCGHKDSPPVPALVLDCFSGTGTTAIVAAELGRHGIGVDLSSRYLAQSAIRFLESEQDGKRLIPSDHSLKEMGE